VATRRDLIVHMHSIDHAVNLLKLGLRVPMVCEMTRLSGWFIRKLAIEACAEKPPKGQVPNSELWYLRGRNNLHASLFASFYLTLKQGAGIRAEASVLLVKAFQQYRTVMEEAGLPEVLTPDRAWWLIKSLTIPQLKRERCLDCQGHYLVHVGDLVKNHRCARCSSHKKSLQ
jgi:flagellar transcriptional activator FlhC